jgi:indole-3-glycerol phosphate synthase
MTNITEQAKKDVSEMGKKRNFSERATEDDFMETYMDEVKKKLIAEGKKANPSIIDDDEFDFIGSDGEIDL